MEEEVTTNNVPEFELRDTEAEADIQHRGEERVEIEREEET